MDRPQILETPLFNGLDEKQAQSLISLSSEKVFQAGHTIFSSSGQDMDFGLILQGRVCIELAISEAGLDRRVTFVILKPGEIFGEIGFLRGKWRSAYVVAKDDVSALIFDGKGVAALLDQDAGLGRSFMKNLALILSERLINANYMWRLENM